MFLKRLTTIVALLLLSVGVNAQYKTVLLGLKAGGNLGWIRSSSEGYINEGIRPGFSLGFVSEFYFMENYAFLTGMNMQYLGGKLKYPANQQVGGLSQNGELSRKYRLNYLQIPFTVKMKANLSDQFNFYGKVGLGVAFNLDAKAEDTFTYEIDNVIKTDRNIPKEISLVRGSIILGLGAEYIIKGSTALFADLTLDNGFVDIFNGKSNTVNPEVDHKAVNSFIELGIGVIF